MFNKKIGEKMLSKKYYKELAEIFKFGYQESYESTYYENGNFDNNRIGTGIPEMQWKLIDFLKEDNPRFNENKFIKAMDINLEELKKELDS